MIVSKKNSAACIVLTGGGTAGHVIPHLALLPYLQKEKWQIVYIGSNGIEKSIINQLPIKYKAILVGKLRRYLSLQNLTDVFKVFVGTIQSIYYLASIKPNLVFSKGGYVSVPVAIAAKLLCIPVVTHESDLTPGLANRIIGSFANRILYSFAETQNLLPKGKSVLTGTPIRDQLLSGSKVMGLQMCGFEDDPNATVLLIMGGSQGAQLINDVIAEALDELLQRFKVIHIAGKGKKPKVERQGYYVFEYVDQGLSDLFAAADIVLSRAGANSIFEFLALKKPMLLVPLQVGSRGDQVDNAKIFAQKGWAKLLREDVMSQETLLSSLDELIKEKDAISNQMSKSEMSDAKYSIIEQLKITMSSQT